MKLTSDTEDVFICRVYNDLNQILFGQGQITITSKTYTKSQILNNHHTKYQGLASCDSVESFFFNDRVSFIIFCCCWNVIKSSETRNYNILPCAFLKDLKYVYVLATTLLNKKTDTEIISYCIIYVQSYCTFHFESLHCINVIIFCYFRFV